jgi:hypothetical protein
MAAAWQQQQQQQQQGGGHPVSSGTWHELLLAARAVVRRTAVEWCVVEKEGVGTGMQSTVNPAHQLAQKHVAAAICKCGCGDLVCCP